MKKIVMVLFLAFSLSAIADGHHGGGWVGPLVGGIAIGAIGGGLYYNQQRYYAPPPPVYVPNYPSYGSHYETMFDPYCQCYKQVLVPNY